MEIKEEYVRNVKGLESELKSAGILYGKIQIELDKSERRNKINEYIKMKLIEYDKNEVLSQKKILMDLGFKDFQFLQRLGYSKTNGFYGVNGVVYLASLKNSNENYVVKMAFNYGHGKGTKTINNEFIKKEIIQIPYHPNIITVLWYFIDDLDQSKLPGFEDMFKIGIRKCFGKRAAFLVFRYYHKNLEQFIRENQSSITEVEVLLKIMDLLKGICHLQKHKICHRDIKPDNVFLNAQGRLIIADFGCFLNCKSGFRFLFTEQMDHHFNRGGSPFYICPEVLNCVGGKESYIDYSKNDIFAVGLITYGMIGNQNPFKTEDRLEIQKIDSSRFSKRLKEVVYSMIEVDPKDRIDCFRALEMCNEILESQISDKVKEEENEGENEDEF